MISSETFKFGFALMLWLLWAPLGAEAANSPLKVAVSIPPLETLLGSLGGDLIEIQVLLPPGQDPHTYAPSPKQVERLAKSDVFFTLQMPFEKQLVQKLKANAPQLRVTNINQGVSFRSLEPHDHSHEEEEEKEDQLDPHTWLAPKNLLHQVKNMEASLSELQPQNQARFQKAKLELQRRINRVDQDLTRRFLPYRGQAIYVFHPAFGYFTQAYGLIQKSIEHHGKQPTPRQILELVKEARAHQVKFILLQPQVDPRAAQAIANSIDAKILSLDPLGGDILANLEEIARVVEKALHR